MLILLAVSYLRISSKDLLDLNIFNTVKVRLDTLCWDNGVDFAPEYLYEKIREGKRVT